MRCLFIACCVAFVAPQSVSAWCQLTTGTEMLRPGECSDEGVPLAWPRRCVTYSVDAAGGPEISGEVLAEVARRSFASWTAASCGDVELGFAFTETPELAECRFAQYRTSAGNVNTIAFSEEWPAIYDDTAYAVTTVWRTRDGEILDADILFNPESGPYEVCPRGGCSIVDGQPNVDVENILTHEVGHLLGLGHSLSGFATMNATALRGETEKRSLSSDDTTGVCTIYPPEGAPAECDGTPRGGLDLACRPDEGCSAAGGADWAWLVVALVFIRRR